MKCPECGTSNCAGCPDSSGVCSVCGAVLVGRDDRESPKWDEFIKEVTLSE